MPVVKHEGSNFSEDTSSDYQQEVAEVGSELLSEVNLDALKGVFTTVTSDALEAGASLIGLEEQAEACSEVSQFGGALGGSAGALIGGLLLGPLGAVGVGLAGAASGAATYGSACTAVLATKKGLRNKEDVFQGIYETEEGFSTFPLPASVWEDVIAPVLSGPAPKVGPGSIRPSAAIARPVELERLQARQAERQAQSASGSALAVAGIAALLAYKLL